MQMTQPFTTKYFTRDFSGDIFPLIRSQNRFTRSAGATVGELAEQCLGVSIDGRWKGWTREMLDRFRYRWWPVGNGWGELVDPSVIVL